MPEDGASGPRGSHSKSGGSGRKGVLDREQPGQNGEGVGSDGIRGFYITLRLIQKFFIWFL